LALCKYGDLLAQQIRPFASNAGLAQHLKRTTIMVSTTIMISKTITVRTTITVSTTTTVSTTISGSTPIMVSAPFMVSKDSCHDFPYLRRFTEIICCGKCSEVRDALFGLMLIKCE